MPKYIVELYLDGYDTEKEMVAACDEFIYDQLNITASSVKVTKIEDKIYAPKFNITYGMVCTRLCSKAKLDPESKSA